MSTLTEIMASNGCDKAVGLHNYTGFYSLLFEPLRQKNLDLLEIGIGSINQSYPATMYWWRDRYTPGASLRGWKDYFPNAKVYGCDIDRDTLFTEDRIETFHLDQTDRVSVKKEICDVDRAYDIIIDDGIHHFQTNFEVLEQIYPRLKSGGYYIIEDINDFNGEVMSSAFVRGCLSRGDHCSYVQIANSSNTNGDNNLFLLAKA